MFTSPVARRAPRTPPSHRPRLRVDRLEGRDVPAANPLATFGGSVDAPHQPNWVQMQVETSSDRVLLAFETEPAAGSSFEPGPLKLFAGEGARARALGAGGHGFVLRGVDTGIHFAKVNAAAHTTGAFDVTVSLAGDVNGDHAVGADDLDAIRNLRGVRAGQDGYLAAADVNHNGVIGAGDLQLAARNLGRTAAVGDVTADQFLFANSGPRFAQFNSKLPPISLIVNGINDSNSPIAADGFAWTVTNPGGLRPTAGDLQVVAPTGSASPLLFRAVALGTKFADATLFAGRIGTGPSAKPKLEWDMNNVLVSSYSISGSPGHGTSLEDAFTLNFTKLRVTYTPTLPTGRAGTPVTAAFDFATGQAG
jgi:type VI protein secretion system component Hcp